MTNYPNFYLAGRTALVTGEPMDVAGAVVFLASPAAGMITGDTLMIDGGWTARAAVADDLPVADSAAFA